MDSAIKCRECGRIVGIGEFAGYGEAYLLKCLVAAGAVTLLIKTFMDSISTPTRGFIDGQMAAFGNTFLDCPQCGKKSTWDPISSLATEPIQKTKRKSTKKAHLADAS